MLNEKKKVKLLGTSHPSRLSLGVSSEMLPRKAPAPPFYWGDSLQFPYHPKHTRIPVSQSLKVNHLLLKDGGAERGLCLAPQS